MNKIDVIQKGGVAKYQLTIEREDFSMDTCDFSVTLYWGLYGQSLKITKEHMVHDEEWNVFFLFDTSDMIGAVTAECEYWVPDSDVDGSSDAAEQPTDRREVDRQRLCFVTDVACTRLQCCKCEGDGFVTYKRMMGNDMRTLYLIVRTKDKDPVVTAEGMVVRVRKEQH